MSVQSLVLTEHQKKMLKASLDWRFSENFPRFVLYDKKGNLFEECKGLVPVSYLYTELKEAFLKNPEAELGVLLGGAPWQTLCVDPSGEEQLKKMVSPAFFDSVFYYKKCSKDEKNRNEVIQSYYFIENVNSNFFQSVELFPGCRLMGFNETLPFAFSFFEDFYISTEKNKMVMSFPPELLKLKESIEKENLNTLFSIEKDTGIDFIETPTKILFKEDEKDPLVVEKEVLDLAEFFFGSDVEDKSLQITPSEKFSLEEQKNRQVPNPLYLPSESEKNQKNDEKTLDNPERPFVDSFVKEAADKPAQDLKEVISKLQEESEKGGEKLSEPELDAYLQEKFIKKPSLPPMVYPENPAVILNSAVILEQRLWEKMFFFTLINALSLQKLIGDHLETAISSSEINRHTGSKIETLYTDMQRFGELHPEEAQRMLKMLSPTESETADKTVKDMLATCRSSLLAGINTPPRPNKIRTAERKSIRIF